MWDSLRLDNILSSTKVWIIQNIKLYIDLKLNIYLSFESNDWYFINPPKTQSLQNLLR